MLGRSIRCRSRTDLKAGHHRHASSTRSSSVEKLHFQSRPGLYVTGNLYVPKRHRRSRRPRSSTSAATATCVQGRRQLRQQGRLPASRRVVRPNGYVCLTIDTLQLGEIEGIHHGTYRYEHVVVAQPRLHAGRRRGLELHPGARLPRNRGRKSTANALGVTGRSGGGAYSWWIAALDERIKAAVPVAGITDLQNHVVDGCVEGHCDCMFMVNTYRWDYPQVAALVAPRPLLICQHRQGRASSRSTASTACIAKSADLPAVRRRQATSACKSAKARTKISQELQVAAFRWFNRFLKGEDAPVENTGIKYFEVEQLKVFESLPADEITSRIHETFVPMAEPPKVPENQEEWAQMRDGWMKAPEGKVLCRLAGGAGAVECGKSILRRTKRLGA